MTYHPTSRVGIDHHEKQAPDGEFWAIKKKGSRWVVEDPGGDQVRTETSKARTFEACDALIDGQRPKRKGASPEELAHRARVKALGCVINDQHCGGALHYHHVKPRQDGRGICLCFNHHDAQAVYGIAFHAGEESFADRYTTEIELLELVTEQLAVAEVAA